MSVNCIKDGTQEDQRQPKGGGIMTPKNVTTIYLTVTTASDLVSVDNRNIESVLTRASIETTWSSSQPDGHGKSKFEIYYYRQTYCFPERLAHRKVNF